MPFTLRTQRLDEHTKVYHSKKELTNEASEIVRKYQKYKDGSDEDPVNSLGEAACLIPGIEYCHVMPYRLIVTKGIMWEWDQIDLSQIEKILISFNFEEMEDRR